jgi:hypothetical protein
MTGGASTTGAAAGSGAVGGSTAIGAGAGGGTDFRTTGFFGAAFFTTALATGLGAVFTTFFGATFFRTAFLAAAFFGAAFFTAFFGATFFTTFFGAAFFTTFFGAAFFTTFFAAACFGAAFTAVLAVFRLGEPDDFTNDFFAICASFNAGELFGRVAGAIIAQLQRAAARFDDERRALCYAPRGMGSLRHDPLPAGTPAIVSTFTRPASVVPVSPGISLSRVPAGATTGPPGEGARR